MTKRSVLSGAVPSLMLLAVAVFGVRDATAHHRVVEIYDNFGVLQGDSIEVVASASLHALTNGFVVTDGNGGPFQRARIYDAFGEQQGDDIQGDGQVGVVSRNNVVAVVDDARVRFFTVFGNPLGVIETNVRASLFPISESIWVVVESVRVRIFSNLGAQIGNTIATNLLAPTKPRVAVGNTRFAVSDLGRVRIFDVLGNLAGAPIASTPQKLALLAVAKNGVFIVTDDSSVRFFNLLGTQVGDAVAVTFPPTIVTTVGRIVLVETTRVRLYRDNDGGLVTEIATTGPGLPTAVANIERVVVRDTGQARLRFFDLSGALTRTMEPVSQAEVIVTVNNRFVVLESNRASILDPFGSSVNDNIPTVGRAGIDHAADKIFITDNKEVRIFDHFGTPRGQTFDTDSRAGVIANVSAIGINADGQFQIYNHLNETLGPSVEVHGNVNLAANSGRIAIVYDHGQGQDVPITGLTLDTDGPTLLGRPTNFTATIVTGTNVTFVWSFGDGSVATGEMVTHTYKTTGSFQVRVTASNSVGDDFRLASVDVVEPPESVNLKVNGQDPAFPAAVASAGPVRLTIDMTSGPDVLDHYYAIAFNGTVFWVTSAGLSTTPAPLGSFAALDLTDVAILDSTLVPGDWIFGWFILNGANVVASDLIRVNVGTP